MLMFATVNTGSAGRRFNEGGSLGAAGDGTNLLHDNSIQPGAGSALLSLG
jgi:hypothetical protein